MSARNHIGCTAEEFALWRARMGWTQQQAADELGLERRTLQRYEKGQKIVPMVVWRSCKLLFLATEDFAMRSQPMARHELILWIQQYAQKETLPEQRIPAHKFE